ncbi:unnamed protein product [Periconia digitata]|uniref:Zn(2)-C6 fungal-type domain-containing protein n=1 Tax=Periconia digitata TaxID=1303443 RepID=A0A9W4UHT3_9PLEO|nr:unnamed protein product [Periconia digitata]
MKLACVRCKRKKVKCDKGEPSCNHCITAKTSCEYVSRRQRPRLAQQRNAVQYLNRRLEIIEQSLTHSTHATPERQSSSPQTSSAASGVVLPDDGIDAESVSEVPLAAENGQDSWIYRMATDAQRNFQTQLIPDSPLAGIDDAMLSLNEALKDLGKLRIRNNVGNQYASLNLSAAEATECIDAFLDLARNMVLPDFDHTYMSMDLLRALPVVIDSPFVNIDPVVNVMYYNAIYYGIQEIYGSNDQRVQAAYFKVLEAVPAWLEAPPESPLNGFTAALTTWTTLTNHDYQLAWKFHCKACQHIKLGKVDSIDAIPAKTFKDESDRNDGRFLYWHILCTDLTFRLFFGKPTVVRWVPDKIRPPSIFNPDRMHPTAGFAMILVVWVRYTLITAEAVNYVDSIATDDRNATFYQTVDEYCMKIEHLMKDWRMEAEMKAITTPQRHRAIMADHYMNAYAMIVGIRRLARPPTQNNRVDDVTLRAARNVVGLTLELSNHQSPEDAKLFAAHFISFYPFCSVFSLYEHIITSTDPEQCEQDTIALEKIGVVMTRASAARPHFATLERTINALNKVARAIQNERRSRHTSKTTTPLSSNTPRPILGPSTTFDTLQDFADSIPNFDAAALDAFGEFSGAEVGGVGGGAGFHPMGFVRAVETDYVGRNWNEQWWDINHGMS